jgi:hypothetical protein
LTNSVRLRLLMRSPVRRSHDRSRHKSFHPKTPWAQPFRSTDSRQSVGAGFVDGPLASDCLQVARNGQHRMALAQKQPPAGAEQVGDGLRPAIDTRNPTQRADSGEYQIELCRAQRGYRVVNIRFNEIDRGAGLFGQPPSSGRSNRTASLRNSGSATNRSTAYSCDAAGAGALVPVGPVEDAVVVGHPRGCGTAATGSRM